MGRDLHQEFSQARAVFEEADQALGVNLSRLMFEGPEAELTETVNAQPAILTHSIAVLRTMKSILGAQLEPPRFVAGHSLGEYSALVAADALNFADAVKLVRARGVAMQRAGQARPGAMAAILGLADEVVENLCAKIHNVWPANYNCPGQLVISGANDAVDEACVEAEREGARRAIRLRVSGAFHSPLVEYAAERLRPAIDRIDFKAPKAQFVSTVTAKVEEVQRCRTLLVDQLTAPVRFTHAAREMIGQGVTTFVEVGPGNVLSGLLKRIDSSVKAISVNDLKSLDAAAQELA
jgi:[acyl-carrier-protein] S-malonyltransferase